MWWRVTRLHLLVFLGAFAVSRGVTDCGDYPSVAGYVTDCTGKKDGDTCTVTCDTGYLKHKGLEPETITCNIADGEGGWDAQTLTCTVQQCKNLIGARSTFDTGVNKVNIETNAQLSNQNTDSVAEIFNSIVSGGLLFDSSNKIEADSDGGSILGGYQNTVNKKSSFSAINGGRKNLIFNANTATSSSMYTVIGGGWNNIATGDYATVVGGVQNSATTNFATIFGGFQNKASGRFSTILGGTSNEARGRVSIAGGFKCKLGKSRDFTACLSFIPAENAGSRTCTVNKAGVLYLCADRVRMNGNDLVKHAGYGSRRQLLLRDEEQMLERQSAMLDNLDKLELFLDSIDSKIDRVLGLVDLQM